MDAPPVTTMPSPTPHHGEEAAERRDKMPPAYTLQTAIPTMV